MRGASPATGSATANGRGFGFARTWRRRHDEEIPTLRRGDPGAHEPDRQGQSAGVKSQRFHARGNPLGERLDEMAQSPGAGALRGEGDGVERAERFDAEQRQRRGRGEFDARRTPRRDDQRRAAVEPLGERRSGDEGGGVLGTHDVSVGGVHGRRCDLVRRNRPVEGPERRERRSRLDPYQKLNAFARISSMAQGRSRDVRVKIRAAAQKSCCTATKTRLYI